MIVYERQQRFRPENARDMIDGLLSSFREVGESTLPSLFASECGNVYSGITCPDDSPLIKYENGQGRIIDVSQTSIYQRAFLTIL